MDNRWPVGVNKYLGDGVYVSHDGYQLWLHVDSRLPIALDLGVYVSLRSVGDVFFNVEADTRGNMPFSSTGNEQ